MRNAVLCESIVLLCRKRLKQRDDGVNCVHPSRSDVAHINKQWTVLVRRKAVGRRSLVSKPNEGR